MATYAVGDIHGCYLTLMDLFRHVGITDDDTVVFLGDLVDRGPRIKETLDYVLNRPNTRGVLGNHEFCFIDWFRAGGEERNAFMYRQGLSDTLRQLGSEAPVYAKRLEERFPYVDSDEGKNFVFCHADYNWEKGKKFLARSGDGHLWNRIDWASHAKYNGPLIIHGHTPCPTEKAVECKEDGTPFAINLDGGAFRAAGGVPWACIRAIRLDDCTIFEQLTTDFKS